MEAVHLPAPGQEAAEDVSRRLDAVQDSAGPRSAGRCQGASP